MEKIFYDTPESITVIRDDANVIFYQNICDGIVLDYMVVRIGRKTTTIKYPPRHENWGYFLLNPTSNVDIVEKTIK